MMRRENLHIRVKPALKEGLRGAAKRRGITVATLLRDMIKEFLMKEIDDDDDTDNDNNE